MGAWHTFLSSRVEGFFNGNYYLMNYRSRSIKEEHYVTYCLENSVLSIQYDPR